MQRIFVSVLLLAALGAVFLSMSIERLESRACRDIGGDLALCASSDMAKLSDHGRVPLDHQDYAIADGPLQLHAGRNETVAFQLYLQNLGDAQGEVKLAFDDFTSDAASLPVADNLRYFLGWYHHVDQGGYTWGPRSRVLDWPASYPDALLPPEAGCGETVRLYDAIAVPQKKHDLQVVWVDLYIPPTQAPGRYHGQLRLTRPDGHEVVQALSLQVWPATLPAKPSITAVGEVYRAYRLEGPGEDMRTAAWRGMSHCYQQIAHAHRTVFLERTPALADDTDWADYDAIYQPVLDGSLFTREQGYYGPGQGEPVPVWRTPWPQDYDIRVEAPLSGAEIDLWRSRAAAWAEHVRERGWQGTDYFAYIFDEVDGPTDESDSSDMRRGYLTMAHTQMRRVQQALDAGSGDIPIDLMWTSHSDPAQWDGVEGVDLAGTIRLWVPNAGAADPQYLGDRAAQGEKVWFYHDGHPHVGVHSINASGIDMRTWGVIGARYAFDGQLMWAVNLGSDERPFARPSYKDDDDRFGNGVMVYPGNQLPKIGYPAAPGPLPSIRLKNWRRGLQDADLVALAKQAGHAAAVDELLRRQMPEALGAARSGAARWSDDPADWLDFHRELLKLASQPPHTAAH
ncbi:DUF4091 domain-containing protein [Granulosicoccaceae sp. 1_MG-2023]|nr:DUF4091 domain-containing protein [Granulosicoccaceae sp. 1_MG-2023]